jgi:hypothetical protein
MYYNVIHIYCCVLNIYPKYIEGGIGGGVIDANKLGIVILIIKIYLYLSFYFCSPVFGKFSIKSQFPKNFFEIYFFILPFMLFFSSPPSVFEDFLGIDIYIK